MSIHERDGIWKKKKCLQLLLDIFPKIWISSEHIQIHWETQIKNVKGKLQLEVRTSCYARSNFPLLLSELAAKCHHHVSVSALSFFPFFFFVCLLCFNHLKIYQATREKIQTSLHVMSVLKQAECLISPIGKARALQPAAGNGVWLQKISRTAYTICSIYVSATFQAVPAVLQGWVVALLWLLPSAKCWTALERDTTTV